MPGGSKNHFHAKKIKEVFNLLKSSIEGLTDKESQKRKKKYGLNKLPSEKRLTILEIIFEQLKSPLIYILLIAVAISFLLREYVDMGVILAAVILNTIVGFVQEFKAEKAISHLKKMVEYKARVLRDGQEMEIKAEDLIPGDIIFLEAGDKIQADARLIEVNNFRVNEASLTGESLPIAKDIKILKKGTVLADRKNMVYMGTAVTKGKAIAIVTSTGLNTHLGEIASLVKEVKEEKTPLQHKLSVFSRWLSIIIGAVSILIIGFGIIKGHSFFEMLLMAVAVAVASIPEGLIVAVTVILVIGMQKILKRKSLVRKLVAAETLGSTSVICTDKTGTLTEGIMQVSEIFIYGKDRLLKLTGDREESLALKIGLLNNNAVIENPKESLKNLVVLGDSTERALLLAAVGAGIDKKELENQMPRIDEIPFDEEKKYMATLHQGDKENIIYIKGAPETILSMSSFVDYDNKKKKIGSKELKNIKSKYEELTAKGLRVLAVGYKKVKKTQVDIKDKDLNDLVFVGLIALKDPLRKEASDTIKKCKQAGIRPIMVTGDHKLTAKAIYEELGLKVKEKNILEGWQLDKMSDEKLQKIIKNVDIFARVEPKHKLRIIDAWQARGEVVAMSGDGVNDAPALKAADIGVALGSGTDVAKETADIILMDDNFSTIVAAVEQGRVIFDNIKKVMLYLLSDSFTEVIIVVGSLLIGLPLPITAAQILWINLVEDGLPDFALAFEPGEKEVMKDKPRPKDEPILDKEMKVLIFIIGIITDLVLFGIFYWLYNSTNDLTYTRTIIFAAVGIDSLVYVFSCRSLRKTIWQKNPFSNMFLVFAVQIGFLMLLVSLYVPFFQKVLGIVPLGWSEWVILIAIGIFEIFAIEITKWIFIVEKKHHKLLNFKNKINF